jgi:hypothetical protein
LFPEDNRGGNWGLAEGKKKKERFSEEVRKAKQEGKDVRQTMTADENVL